MRQKSARPGKQRLFTATMPMHSKSKSLAGHLSKQLREKHRKRSMRVVAGDIVAVVKGQWKKKSGKVTAVNVKKGLVFVEGIEMQKKDGSKSRIPIHPSNLVITQLLESKGRLK